MANGNPLQTQLPAGILCKSEEETRRLGHQIATSLDGPTLLSLEGPLGAGKTCFVKGLAEGLGIPEIDVSSPTFTLVHEYRRGRIPLIHLDLYRVESEEELDSLGFFDYLSEPLVIAVEWGAKFPSALPPGTWHLSFSIKNGGRLIRMMSKP